MEAAGRALRGPVSNLPVWALAALPLYLHVTTAGRLSKARMAVFTGSSAPC